MADKAPRRLTAIDLFAGGGGLTVGLKNAGFDVVAAVELNPHAYATYTANHPEVRAYKQDITTVSGESLLSAAPHGQVDLLAGCPPCQGFTSLAAKYKRTDPRNVLINEMLRLVGETRPRAIMMENVPGLGTKGKQLYDGFKSQLGDWGYEITEDVMQVANFGVPQMRRRLVLFAGLGGKLALPEETHAKDPINGLFPWVTVRDTISGLPAPQEFMAAKNRGVLAETNWHLVRTISEINRKRLAAAKPGKVWTSIPKELRPPCHQGDYVGFTNMYGRMCWDEPSPTITTGCTTISKGRFGHPEQLRTISVREAAQLQTFPGDYKFDTPHMDQVCNIIGNALPCLFAEALANACMQQLRVT